VTGDKKPKGNGDTVGAGFTASLHSKGDRGQKAERQWRL